MRTTFVNNTIVKHQHRFQLYTQTKITLIYAHYFYCLALASATFNNCGHSLRNYFSTDLYLYLKYIDQ